MNNVSGLAGSAGVTAGDWRIAESFTVSDVFAVTGPSEFDAVAVTVSLPPLRRVRRRRGEARRERRAAVDREAADEIVVGHVEDRA